MISLCQIIPLRLVFVNRFLKYNKKRIFLFWLLFLKEYDRIEKSGKILNEVIYYERVEKEVDITEAEAETIALENLEVSLKNELTRDSKVIDKIIKKQLDSNGNLTVKVVFVVEKNIVNNIPVQY